MEVLQSATGVLALIMCVGSYLMRSHRSLTLAAALGTAMWSVHFATLQVWTPCALSALMALRIAAGIVVVHLQSHTRWKLTGLVWALASAGAALTWQGAVSLPSTAATLFLTYAGFHLHYAPLRRALLAAEVLWFFNGMVTQSVLAVVAALIGFVLNLRILWLESRSGAQPALTQPSA